MHLELELPPHYSLPTMIETHGWAQVAPFNWDQERQVLQRIEQLGSGRVVVLGICERNRRLQVEVDALELNQGECENVERVVRWMLELDQDFTEFYSFCAEHPALHHIPLRGLGPMLRSPTVWEDYVKTVYTTNTTWAQTKAMAKRTVDAFGAASSSGAHTFPGPYAVAAAGAEVFAEAVRAGYRAPYIYGSAVEIASGRLDLEQFKLLARELDTPELMRELRKLRGIGPYGAAHLALLLGSYGHIPVDSWARDMVRRHMRGGQPVTDQEVHAAFHRWGRWKALAFNFWNWESAAS